MSHFFTPSTYSLPEDSEAHLPVPGLATKINTTNTNPEQGTISLDHGLNHVAVAGPPIHWLNESEVNFFFPPETPSFTLTHMNPSPHPSEGEPRTFKTAFHFIFRSKFWRRVRQVFRTSSHKEPFLEFAQNEKIPLPVTLRNWLEHVKYYGSISEVGVDFVKHYTSWFLALSGLFIVSMILAALTKQFFFVLS